MMKRSTIIAIVLILTGIPLISTQAGADDAPPNYSGDFLTRSTITGDWGGTRNELAVKGVTFDMSLTQVEQGVVGGGKDSHWDFGGRGNITVNVDTQKLGWWPGGFMNLEVESNYSRSVNGNTGALMPVNSNQIYPVTNGGNNFNISQLYFAQFLSEHAGLYAGKLDTLSGDANEFAHGKGDIQFMNLALNVNPVTFLITPTTTLGAGVIILPTAGDPNASIINISVMQTNGNAKNSGFNSLHSDQLTFAEEARVRTDFFDLTGHQLIGAEYSNKTFTSLDQNLRFTIFDSNRTLAQQDNSWNVYYNFDQYLYEPNKGSGKGIGVFGRFGVSDGNPNPIKYAYNLGFGGKGIIPGRPNDRFGLGYYYMKVSNANLEIQILRNNLTLPSFLRNEFGYEAYYDIAVTPWMLLSPDLQVVRGAQKNVITLNPPTRQSIDTAIVLGVRLQLLF
jgi:porin